MILTLILLNICHWIADYTHLSTNWMLNAKRLGKPLVPILAHASIHAILFFICILMLYGLESAFIAFIIQITTHFMIDLWKGRMNVWFPSLQSPANKFHWYIFGLDQFLHQLIIITICYVAFK